MRTELRGRSVLLLVGNAVARRRAPPGQDRHRRLDEAVSSVARAVLSARGRLAVAYDPSSALVVSHIATEYLSPVHAEEFGPRTEGRRATDARLILLGGRARKPDWIAPLEEIRAVQWNDSNDIPAPAAIVVLGSEVARLHVGMWLERYQGVRVATFAALAATRPARRARVQAVDGELTSAIEAARASIQWQRDFDERLGPVDVREPLRPDYLADPFTLVAQSFVEQLSRELTDDSGSLEGGPPQR